MQNYSPNTTLPVCKPAHKADDDYIQRTNM